MKTTFAPVLLALVVLLAQGSVSAQASTVNIRWQGVDTLGTKLSTLDSTVSATTPVTNNYATTALNYSYVDSSQSFIAYCIEPNQQNGRAGVTRSYSIGSFTGSQSQQLQSLFSTQYASLSSYDDKAAFQVAVWEVMRETGASLNASAGSFSLLGADATTARVASLANGYLATAAGYSGPALYTLTRLSNADLQDLVTATPLTTAVPEPTTTALYLAGIGVVGLLSRRRLRA